VSISDIFELGGKILLVPTYYSDGEMEFSIAASIFCAVMGAAVGWNIVRPNKNTVILLVLLFVLVATFSLYWFYLYQMGGVFYLQTACRVVFFLSLGMLGLSFGKDDQDHEDA
jgi:K+ transporter